MLDDNLNEFGVGDENFQAGDISKTDKFQDAENAAAEDVSNESPGVPEEPLDVQRLEMLNKAEAEDNDTERENADSLSLNDNAKADEAVLSAPGNSSDTAMRQDFERQKRSATCLGIVVGLIGGMIISSILLIAIFGFRSVQRLGVDYRSRRSDSRKESRVDNQGVEEYELDSEKIVDKIESLQKVI